MRFQSRPGQGEVGGEERRPRRAAHAVVVLAPLDGEAGPGMSLDVAGVVGMEVAEDDVADVAEADADLGELAAELMVRLDHRRRVPALGDVEVVEPRRVAEVGFVETGVEQHPALAGVEEVGGDRHRDDEAGADVAGGDGLRDDLEAAEQHEQASDGGHGSGRLKPPRGGRACPAGRKRAGETAAWTVFPIAPSHSRRRAGLVDEASRAFVPPWTRTGRRGRRLSVATPRFRGRNPSRQTRGGCRTRRAMAGRRPRRRRPGRRRADDSRRPIRRQRCPVAQQATIRRGDRRPGRRGDRGPRRCRPRGPGGNGTSG